MGSRADNIILTGFMGSGKTVVGRALASLLGWKYVDLDSMVSRRAGMSIRGIFRRKGEARFRGMEHAAIRAVSRMRRHVVAAGGGAPAFPRNRKWLKRGGVVVYLSVPVPVLARRLRRATDRPLLAPARGDPPALRRLIARLLRGRVKAYRRADLIVRAGRGNPREVARRILAAISPLGRG